MRPYSYLILGVSPTSNEAQVELNEKIVISFAKHIYQDTLNKNNIRLSVVNGGFLDYEGVYDAAAQTYTITPKEEFLPNTQYQTLIMGGKEGVMSIDNSYLPSTKTYEFQTVVQERDIEIGGLSLKQDHYFVSAEWSMPDELAYGEEVYFNVKLSTSKEPEADDVWPTNPLEGKTTSLQITIPYKVELGRNYYVHVQAVRGDTLSEWKTAQLFMEKIPELAREEVEEDKDNVDSEIVHPITEQLAVVDYAPQQGEFTIPEEIVVVFTHPIDPLLFPEKPEEEERPVVEEEIDPDFSVSPPLYPEYEDIDPGFSKPPTDKVENDPIIDPGFTLQPTRNPLFYVVKAPYKEKLSLIDLRGAYHYSKAIDGYITVDKENPNVLVWVRDEEAGAEEFEADAEYTVVISKDLAGVYTFPLGHTFTFGFSGTPEHLHGEMDHIQEVLGSFGLNFSEPYLQSLMKKHSQFACEIWQGTSGYDESLHQNGDAPYFIHGYVNTQVLIDALLRGGLVLHGGGSESITLSELTVTKNGGTLAIGRMLDELRGQLKKWEDLIHDYHNRGYAKPSAVVKGEAVETYPESLTRSQLNTDFEE